MIRTTLRGSLSRRKPFLTATLRNGLIHTTLPFLAKHTDNMHVRHSVTSLPHCGDHKNLIPVEKIVVHFPQIKEMSFRFACISSKEPG